MNLYMYALVKPYYETTKSFDELSRVMTVNKVKEYQGGYENIDEKEFYSPWTDFLPKNKIEKVFRNRDYVGTNIIYSVYLLEDNKTKAMSLIEETARQDLFEIQKQLEEQQNIIGTICDSVHEIKEIG